MPPAEIIGGGRQAPPERVGGQASADVHALVLHGPTVVASPHSIDPEAWSRVPRDLFTPSPCIVSGWLSTVRESQVSNVEPLVGLAGASEDSVSGRS